MEKKLEVLYDLCEVISRELDECNEKIRSAGGKLSAGDVDYLDKLTHALKSIKTTIAMMEAEDEEGYSNRGGNSRRFSPWYGGMSYEGSMGGNSNRGNNYSGRSYARGRANNPTGRNQYSREGGYSYAEDMEETKEEIRELSQKMPEEHRRKIERALDELR